MAQSIHWDPCGKLGYEKDEKYYNHEPQPLYESTNCWRASKYGLTTRLNTTSLTLWHWIRWRGSAWLLMFLVHLTPEWKRKRKLRARVSQSNCGASHKRCIMDCSERHWKVVSGDWCYMSFRIIAESVYWVSQSLRKVVGLGQTSNFSWNESNSNLNGKLRIKLSVCHMIILTHVFFFFFFLIPVT